MKTLAIAVAVVVVLLVAAAAAVPFLVPTEAVARRIVALVEDRTGRELSIGGPIDLAVLPDIEVRLHDLRLSNPEGAAEPDMVRLGALDAEIAVLPLLRGAVVIDRFVLREPVIALEIDAAGRANWRFGAAEAPAAERPAPAGPAPEQGDGGARRLTVADARIVDGAIAFVDRRSGRTLRLADVDLTLALDDLAGPVSAEGRALFNGEAVAIEASVEDAGALIRPDGAPTPIRLALTADPAALTFQGTATGGDAPGADGALRLSVPSTTALSAWLPFGLPADPPVDSVALTGTVDAAADRVALTGMALMLDDVEVAGDLAVSVAGDRPTVIGELAVGALDLDRFGAAPPAEAPARPASADAPAAGSAPADGAATEPTIDLSPLRRVDAEIAVELAGVTVRGTAIGPSRVVVRIEDGALDLSTAETAVFGGTASVELSAAAGDPQTFGLAASLESIDLAPLPFAVAGLDGVAGRVSGDVALRSRGRTRPQLLANLDGTGALTVTDAAATYAPEGQARPIVVSDLDAVVEATPRRILFRDLSVTAAEVAATGDLAVGLGGPRPAVAGALRLGRLDLDRWLDRPEAAPTAGPAGAPDAGPPAGAPGAPSADGGWSAEPIDFSPLGAIDADLDLTTDGVVLRGVETGPTALAVALADGALDARLAETLVFDGTIAGTLRIGAGTTPRLAVTLDIVDVAAEPLLSRAAEFDRIAGTMNGSVALTASGTTPRQIVETLDGDGALLFSDGAIRGVNIAAMLRNVAGAFEAANRGAAQQTDFAELGGTFRIESGLLTSDDVRMLAPLFRVEGEGQSNIPERTLRFRLVPRLVASLEGQGGQTELAGVAVPIIVTGRYGDVAFTPDLAGAIENVVRDPAALDQQLDALGEQAERLKDRIEEDPERAIRGLLEGLTGAAPVESEEPAAAPAEPTTGPADPAAEAPAAPAEPANPAGALLEGIFGGNPQPGDEARPDDPVEQLRGLFGD